MSVSSQAEALLKQLVEEYAVEPARFPVDRIQAARPGVYAWWADEEARGVIGEELAAEVPSLIYVGQAGATRWPSGAKSSATLESRIGRQHIRGNARSSTFRLTLSGLLLKRLELVPAGDGRLEASSNARVTEWVTEHLRIAIAPFEDRDALGHIEEEVVGYLDPPLNLGHCLPSRARARLTELRRALRRQ